MGALRLPGEEEVPVMAAIPVTAARIRLTRAATATASAPGDAASALSVALDGMVTVALTSVPVFIDPFQGRGAATGRCRRLAGAG
jgi:hypothetical protein